MSYENLSPLTSDEIERVRVKKPAHGYPPSSDRLVIPQACWDQMIQDDVIDIPRGRESSSVVVMSRKRMPLLKARAI